MTMTLTNTAPPMASLPLWAYPESDGLPMADNTIHALAIGYIFDVVRTWLHRTIGPENAFIANNILWYYREGETKTRVNPDVLVAFGVADRHRRSYYSWLDGITPQVIFEVVSPESTTRDMLRKYALYGSLGVEEYIVYDPGYGIDAEWPRQMPESASIVGFRRATDGTIEHVEDWIGETSRRIGLRFELGADGRLQLVAPDGTRFDDYETTLGRALDQAALAETEQARAETEQARAETEAARADAEAARAETEAARAETEAARAETEAARAETEQARAETEQARADRLAARLRAAGLDAD